MFELVQYKEKEKETALPELLFEALDDVYYFVQNATYMMAFQTRLAHNGKNCINYALSLAIRYG